MNMKKCTIFILLSIFTMSKLYRYNEEYTMNSTMKYDVKENVPISMKIQITIDRKRIRAT